MSKSSVLGIIAFHVLYFLSDALWAHAQCVYNTTYPLQTTATYGTPEALVSFQTGSIVTTGTQTSIQSVSMVGGALSTVCDSLRGTVMQIEAANQNSYLQLGPFNPAATAFTASFWFYVDSLPTGQGIFPLMGVNSSVSFGLYLNRSSDLLYYSNGVMTPLYPGVTIQPATWNRMTVQSSGTGLTTFYFNTNEIYVSGALLNTTSTILYFGYDIGGVIPANVPNIQYIHGRFDAITVYLSQLSMNSIVTLYDNQFLGTPPIYSSVYGQPEAQVIFTFNSFVFSGARAYVSGLNIDAGGGMCPTKSVNVQTTQDSARGWVFADEVFKNTNGATCNCATVSIPTSTAFTNHSAFAWFKMDSYPAGTGSLYPLIGIAAATTWGFYFGWNGHIIVFKNYGQGNPYSASTLPIQTWIHIGYVYAAGTATLYVNGVAYGITTGLTYYNYPIQFGGTQSSSGSTSSSVYFVNPMVGSIDTPTLFSYALSTQAGQLYWDQSEGLVPSTAVPTTPGPTTMTPTTAVPTTPIPLICSYNSTHPLTLGNVVSTDIQITFLSPQTTGNVFVNGSLASSSTVSVNSVSTNTNTIITQISCDSTRGWILPVEGVNSTNQLTLSIPYTFNNSWTVTFWFSLTSLPSSSPATYAPLVGVADATAFGLYLGPYGDFYLFGNGSTPLVGYYGEQALVLNQWYQMTMTYSATAKTMTLFLNSNLFITWSVNIAYIGNAAMYFGNGNGGVVNTALISPYWSTSPVGIRLDVITFTRNSWDPIAQVYNILNNYYNQFLGTAPIYSPLYGQPDTMINFTANYYTWSGQRTYMIGSLLFNSTCPISSSIAYSPSRYYTLALDPCNGAAPGFAFTPAITGASSEFSVFAWFYFKTIPNPYYQLLMGVQDPTNSWGFFISSGNLHTYVNNVFYSLQGVSLNTWYHIGVTYQVDSTNIRIILYINGHYNLQHTIGAYQGSSVLIGGSIQAGCNTCAYGPGATGYIDMITIFNPIMGLANDNSETALYNDQLVAQPLPNTSFPTTAVPTTAVPTTVIPSTLNPSTLVPTTAIPTTASTSTPTTANPTTASTSTPTTANPTTASTSTPTTALPTTASTSTPTTSTPTTASTSTPTTANPTTASTSAPTTATPTTASTSTPTTANPTTASTSTPTTSNPTTASTSSPTTSIPTTASTSTPTTSNPTTASTSSPTTANPTTIIPTTANATTTSPTTQIPTTASTSVPTTAIPTTANATTATPATVTPTTLIPSTASTSVPTTTIPTTANATTAAPTTLIPSTASTSTPTTMIPTTVFSACNYPTTFNLTNYGFTDWNFGSALGWNPSLVLIIGYTYTFNINVVGHPFHINRRSTTGTGSMYPYSVIGQGAQLNTLTFTPTNVSLVNTTLYYNCEYHTLMTGSITFVLPSSCMNATTIPITVAPTVTTTLVPSTQIPTIIATTSIATLAPSTQIPTTPNATTSIPTTMFPTPTPTISCLFSYQCGNNMVCIGGTCIQSPSTFPPTTIPPTNTPTPTATPTIITTTPTATPTITPTIITPTPTVIATTTAPTTIAPTTFLPVFPVQDIGVTFYMSATSTVVSNFLSSASYRETFRQLVETALEQSLGIGDDRIVSCTVALILNLPNTLSSVSHTFSRMHLKTVQGTNGIQANATFNASSNTAAPTPQQIVRNLTSQVNNTNGALNSYLAPTGVATLPQYGVELNQITPLANSTTAPTFSVATPNPSSTGVASSTSTQSFSIGDIVGTAIGGFAATVAIIMVIVLCVRNSNDGKGPYAQLDQK